MRIKFNGGADEVGRSSISVFRNNSEIVLDYGVKIGDVEQLPQIQSIPKNIVITHTHLDHAAYLPHLFTRKRATKVHMTKPTRDLIQLMIADYMKVSNHKFDSSKVLTNLLKNTFTYDYREIFRAGRFRVSLHPSGHILGSASILLHNKEGNLLYTGDFNTRKSRILEPVERGLRAKTLVIESTYGAKSDVIPSQRDEFTKLRKIIIDTVERGGKVIIPSFAVGRAQELILALDAFMRNGSLPPMPIYIDGMIKKALRIYRHNVIYARKELQRSILVNDIDPFKSNFVYLPKSRTRLDAIENASIIITTSGMLKGGPVITYLKHLAGDKNNSLVFVGYQAEGTPGRKILEGKRKIILDDNEVKFNLKIYRLKISAHADHKGILEYIDSVRGLKNIFIVHGEDFKRRELKEDIIDKHDFNVYLPSLGEEFDV